MKRQLPKVKRAFEIPSGSRNGWRERPYRERGVNVSTAPDILWRPTPILGTAMDRQQIIALVLTLLMVGSSVAYAAVLVF